MYAMKYDMKTNIKPNIKYILLFIFTTLADRISKAIIEANFFEGEIRPLINNILYAVYSKNQGAAYGIGSNAGWLINIIAVILIIVMLFVFMKYKSVILRTGVIFVISGGANNIYDRIFNNGVTDFIYIKPLAFVFANFNFADIFITAGVILMGVYILFFDKKVTAQD